MTKHDPNRGAEILAVIQDYQAHYGYAPSVREIMVRVGLSSTAAVHHHLIKLERAGMIQRGAGRGRAIRVTVDAAVFEQALMAVLMDPGVSELRKATQDLIVQATSLILKRRDAAHV